MNQVHGVKHYLKWLNGWNNIQKLYMVTLLKLETYHKYVMVKDLELVPMNQVDIVKMIMIVLL